MIGNIRNKIALIRKIDKYSEDRIAQGDILPHGKLWMRFSAVYNYIFYGTSFSEYFAYRFYALNRKEKKTYMTRRHMFSFFDKYNPENMRERINDKRVTKEYYGCMMKRDQFKYSDGFEEFCRFTEKYPRLFIKKAISWGGYGSICSRCCHL